MNGGFFFKKLVVFEFILPLKITVCVFRREDPKTFTFYYFYFVLFGWGNNLFKYIG